MTQENKELLLKDLCARLPYETRVRYTFAFAGAACINEYSDEGILSYDKLQDFSLYPKYGLEKTRVYNISPYLRPMSSMTTKEEYEYHQCCAIDFNDFAEEHLKLLSQTTLCFSNHIDWLNAHHFDYRGLIEKGLALETTENMYKTK